MSLHLTIKVRGIAGVKANLSRLDGDLRGRAMAAAINKTAQKARAEISRAVRQEYAVDATRVRNAIELHNASAKADGRLVAWINIFGSSSKRGRSLNLIHFLETKVSLAERRRRSKAGTQQQLRFRIKKGGPLITIPGAFIGNKGRTIFVRENPNDPKSAIRPLQVIDIQQMFSSTKIRTRVLAKINADLPIEVQRAVRWMLARNA
jgi:hypothetical protein